MQGPTRGAIAFSVALNAPSLHALVAEKGA